MPKGELFIKINERMTPAAADRFTLSGGAFVQDDNGDWVDTYSYFGLSFSQSGLSSLMTPAPNKAMVENKSRRQHGKRISKNQELMRKDERDVNIEMHITASNISQFWARYDIVCDELLDYGYMEFVNGYRPTKVFRMTFQGCSQFTEFGQQMAKFTLRLNEPDPTNRGFNDKWEEE